MELKCQVSVRSLVLRKFKRDYSSFSLHQSCATIGRHERFVIQFKVGSQVVATSGILKASKGKGDHMVTFALDWNFEFKLIAFPSKSSSIAPQHHELFHKEGSLIILQLFYFARTKVIGEIHVLI